MSNAQISTDERFAVYGTLAPGRVNHHELASLRGRWLNGTVQGHLVEAGWGASLGYPGLHLDPSGPTLEVFVLESTDLPDHWARMDEFEGVGYQRVTASVETSEGTITAWIYVLAS